MCAFNVEGPFVFVVYEGQTNRPILSRDDVICSIEHFYSRSDTVQDGSPPVLGSADVLRLAVRPQAAKASRKKRQRIAVVCVVCAFIPCLFLPTV